jgi:hypothetical protein
MTRSQVAHRVAVVCFLVIVGTIGTLWSTWSNPGPIAHDPKQAVQLIANAGYACAHPTYSADTPILKGESSAWCTIAHGGLTTAPHTAVIDIYPSKVREFTFDGPLWRHNPWVVKCSRWSIAFAHTRETKQLAAQLAEKLGCAID